MLSGFISNGESLWLATVICRSIRQGFKACALDVSDFSDTLADDTLLQVLSDRTFLLLRDKINKSVWTARVAHCSAEELLHTHT